MAALTFALAADPRPLVHILAPLLLQSLVSEDLITYLIVVSGYIILTSSVMHFANNDVPRVTYSTQTVSHSGTGSAGSGSGGPSETTIQVRTETDEFATIPDSMWWSIITFSTVGYGDAVPQAPLAKLFGAFAAITGLFLLNVPLGFVLQAFTEVYEIRSLREQRVWEVVHRLFEWSDRATLRVRARHIASGAYQRRMAEESKVIDLRKADGKLQEHLGDNMFVLGTKKVVQRRRMSLRGARSDSITAKQAGDAVRARVSDKKVKELLRKGCKFRLFTMITNPTMKASNVCVSAAGCAFGEVRLSSVIRAPY